MKTKSTKATKSKLVLYGGLLFSIFWLALLAAMVISTKPCPGTLGYTGLNSESYRSFISCRDVNELGDFLAGAFAPLAFLWLVITVFLQSKELAAQREELSFATEAADKQADFSGKHVAILEGEQQKALLEAAANSIGFRLRTNQDFAKVEYYPPDGGTKYVELVPVSPETEKRWNDFDDRLVHWCSQELQRNFDTLKERPAAENSNLFAPLQFETVFSAIEDAMTIAPRLKEVGRARMKAMGIDRLHKTMVTIKTFLAP